MLQLFDAKELELNYYTLLTPQNVTTSYGTYYTYNNRKLSDYDFLSFYVGVISENTFYPRGYIRIPQVLFRQVGNSNIYRVDVPTTSNGQSVSFRFRNDTSIDISAFGISTIGIRVFGEIVTKR